MEPTRYRARRTPSIRVCFVEFRVGKLLYGVLPKRWIVERTFGWLRRDRRLAKDYERKVQTSETLIEVAMIRLILRRLARAA